MATVGLVSTSTVLSKGLDPETAQLCEALKQTGVSASLVAWHEPRNWSRFDLLVVRSLWDYQDRIDEFHQWLTLVDNATRVLNAPQLIRWNLDKIYLSQLRDYGVRTCPTTYCRSLEQCEREIDRLSKRHKAFVVKPNISASSENTGLFTNPGSPASELCQTILNLGKTVLIQPAIERVQAGGERALLYFNGEFSHACAKGAILRPGGGYLDHRGENITEVSVSADEAELGSQTLASLKKLAADLNWNEDAKNPLYARIDVVTPESEPPVLLEAELFEPALYLRYSDGALKRFVDAITAHLS